MFRKGKNEEQDWILCADEIQCNDAYIMKYKKKKKKREACIKMLK